MLFDRNAAGHALDRFDGDTELGRRFPKRAATTQRAREAGVQPPCDVGRRTRAETREPALVQRLRGERQSDLRFEIPERVKRGSLSHGVPKRAEGVECLDEYPTGSRRVAAVLLCVPDQQSREGRRMTVSEPLLRAQGERERGLGTRVAGRALVLAALRPESPRLSRLERAARPGRSAPAPRAGG